MQVVNDTEPTPACACFALAAGSFSLAMNSFRFAAGKSFARDDQDRRPGDQAERLKSFAGSYLRFA